MKKIALITFRDSNFFSKNFLGLPLLSRLVLKLREFGFEQFYIIENGGKGNDKFLESINILRKEYNVEIKLSDPKKIESEIYSLVSKEESKLIIAFLPTDLCPDSLSEKIEKTLTSMASVTGFVIEFKDPKKGKKFFLTKICSTNKDLIGEYLYKMITESDSFNPEELGDRGLEIVSITVNEGDIIFINDQNDIISCEKKTLKNLAKHDDGIISRHINRRISTFLSKKLVGTRITPNKISLTSFVLMIVASLLLALGGIIYWFLGGILTQVSSIIDGCDGEIARLRFKPSAFGALLDTILDRYSDISLLIGIAFYYSKLYDSILIIIFISVSLSATLLSGLARKEFTLRFGRPIKDNLLTKLTRRDARLFVIFIASSGLNLLYPNSLFLSVFVYSLYIHFAIIYVYLIKNRSAV